MRSKILVLASFAGLLFLAPAISSAATCDKACNKMMTVVQHSETDAVAVLLSMDQATAPVRQNAVVVFRDPVKVRDRILMGKYIIEHDNDRMGRGEPCTHIYDFKTKKLVVAFHCTHLTRPASNTAQVVLSRRGDPLVRETLTEFQYSNDTASHGVPVLR